MTSYVRTGDLDDVVTLVTAAGFAFSTLYLLTRSDVDISKALCSAPSDHTRELPFVRVPVCCPVLPGHRVHSEVRLRSDLSIPVHFVRQGSANSAI